MRFKTVKLELMRKGQQFAALLAPTTDYYALCDNHEVVDVRVPFDHRSLLHQIRVLRYEQWSARRPGAHGDEAESETRDRDHALEQLARELRAMLEQIPGLIGELNSDETQMTHLRILVSAPELALLPFELALGLKGTSSAGLPLTLQPVAPLTITREVRRDFDRPLPWPRRPKILFASATAPGMMKVPVAAHWLELRRAIQPWVGAEGGCLESDLLTVVQNASLHRIRSACREHEFTHVHILAHGAMLPGQPGEDRFGLALMDRTLTGTDVVSGQRLVDALRVHHETPGDQPGVRGFIRSPTVVTIAACDSGNPGAITAPGSSLAHTLHSNGVPLVVGSQFPLSMQGSVVLASAFYRRVIQGHDPRLVLHDVRQQLHAASAVNHDWASLVVYALLPENLEDQLERVRSECSRHTIAAAMARSEVDDEVLHRIRTVERARKASSIPDPQHDSAAPEPRGATLAQLEQHAQDLGNAIHSLPGVAADDAGVLFDHVRPRVEELALQASLIKRQARIFHRQAEAHSESGDQKSAATARKQERAALMKSCQLYDQAFRLDRGGHWAGIQVIALRLVLGQECDGGYEDYWLLCKAAANLDRNSADRATRAWACASLLELAVLETERDQQPDVRDKLGPIWTEFLASASERELRSTVRQLGRYEKWFTHLEYARAAVEGLLDRHQSDLARVL